MMFSSCDLESHSLDGGLTFIDKQCVLCQVYSVGVIKHKLHLQASKKVAKFVHNNTLTGAVAEIGLLCSAVVYASPRQGIVDLMRPIMSSVLSSLNDCPPTGFSGVSSSQAVFDLKVLLKYFTLNCQKYVVSMCKNCVFFADDFVTSVGGIYCLSAESCVTGSYVWRRACCSM